MPSKSCRDDNFVVIIVSGCDDKNDSMAWQWAETLVEIRGTLADIGGTTK